MLQPTQPDPIFLASLLVRMHFHSPSIDITGSGFAINTRCGAFLVTAKHNLTGRELNGKPKHPTLALPTHVSINNFFGRMAKRVPLYDDGISSDTGDPLYLYLEDRDADVALLPLPKGAAQHQANFLDPSLWRPETYQQGIGVLQVADLCHVIGYPEGLTNNLSESHVLPLWKTGHLANDPQYDFNGKNLCLIDATTRPGMSGAPVFMINHNGVTDTWRSAGSEARRLMQLGGPLPRLAMPEGPIFQRRSRLVGVYTGRTSDTSDIGLVWRSPIIHSILSKYFESW